jgi:hypothetical protein
MNSNEQPMKMRTLIATIHHAESGTKEERQVTIIDESPEYQLTMLYVVELGKSVVFQKSTNTILLPD